MKKEEPLGSLARRIILSDIREVISRIPFLDYSINSFLFGITEDEDSKKLKFEFEIREKISFIELGIIHSEINNRIVAEIKNIDRYFNDFLLRLTNNGEPDISFFSFGEGPFKGITVYRQGHYYYKIRP